MESYDGQRMLPVDVEPVQQAFEGIGADRPLSEVAADVGDRVAFMAEQDIGDE